MTSAPDLEMQARSHRAAALTANALCKWCDLPPRGALWNAVYEAAWPANLDMLKAQREDDQARLIAKVVPQNEAAHRPADKITGGLKDARITIEVAGTIFDMLPRDVKTQELFNQILCAVAPHISADERILLAPAETRGR